MISSGSLSDSSMRLCLTGADVASVPLRLFLLLPFRSNMFPTSSSTSAINHNKSHTDSVNVISNKINKVVRSFQRMG